MKPSGDSALTVKYKKEVCAKSGKAKRKPWDRQAGPTKCVSNPATPTTLCGHFLKCSFTEECKKYPTGPVLLISDHCPTGDWLCADPPCLSDYGTRESYVTESAIHSFPLPLPSNSSHSQKYGTEKVSLPHDVHQNRLPCVSPIPHKSHAFVSLHSLLWKKNSNSSISLLKKKENVFSSTL